MLIKITHLLILLVGLLMVNACSDSVSSTEPPKAPPTVPTPPTLPTMESMTLDLSTFNEEMSSQDGTSDTEYTNFNNAVFLASLLDPVVDWSFGLPRKLFETAKDIDANLNERDEWVWTYSKSANQETYEVRLVGRRQNANTLYWECYVTSTDQNIKDFLFFTGTSNNSGTEGTWTYYDIITLNDQSPEIESTWSMQENSASLMFEVLGEENEYTGDTVEYSFNGTLKNVVFNNVHISETSEMQWNTETLAGYLIVPSYNNGEKACWDSNFQNVACAE